MKLTKQLNTQQLNTLLNKGTGAGGKLTTHNGKRFEQITDNHDRLLTLGFKQMNDNKASYLMKKYDDKTIIFIKQGNFKNYIKSKYNVNIFRSPDEAYIINYHTNNPKKLSIKILEKKNQNVEGSVETKLWSGPSLKREYELVFGSKLKPDEYNIDYGFCVNTFLQEKFTSDIEKYKLLNIILGEHDIPVFFGEEKDYFDLLNKWVGIY